MARCAHRVLLRVTGVLCVAGSALSVSRAGHPATPVERIVYLMGTRVRLVAFDDNTVGAANQLEAFVQSLEETDRELSVWQPDTVLSRLNRQPVGRALRIDRRLCRMFDEVSRWQRETEGAFDPGILPLTGVWDLRGRGRIPHPEDLARARQRSGMANLRFSPDECVISRLGDVAIDSGAFGKGEALDRVAALRVANRRPWMIDLGGQVMVHGRSPDPLGWRVAVSHPTRRDQPAFELILPGGSLAVSGGSERDLEATGARIGHILDPRTGRPARFKGSVAVWHERALVADILSTALYVMGPETGIAWADARKIAACFLEASASDPARVNLACSMAFEQRFDVHPSLQPASSPTAISPESSASANTPPPQFRSSA